jgi:glutamate N-acetyltransferase / amino-acid N-acetyltransferase
MSHTVSPLAPKKQAKIIPVAGVTMATAEASIRYKNRTDVLLIALSENTTVAGVFTRSKCPSAAVDLCRENLKHGKARALLVNSGNANAFTGQKGYDAAQTSAHTVAQTLDISAHEVFVASTGVIGEPLDASKFEPVMPTLKANLRADGLIDAACAIMTTDTFPKAVSRTAKLGDATITLSGIAKGAGMIAPDMATMLSFLFTDAPISAPVLQALLSRAVGTTFNSITIDGDTSTSDTLLLFATGEAAKNGAPLITDIKDKRLTPFKRILKSALSELSELVVRDGEGARKLVHVDVVGAISSRSAKRIANSIANSPLVKTAIAGEDANWGRIVMAVGKAGEPADRDKLSIYFGDIRVAHEGLRDPHYDETAVSALMKEEIITIRVDIGLGRGKARISTCDLTKEYVAINGDYRS